MRTIIKASMCLVAAAGMAQQSPRSNPSTGQKPRFISFTVKQRNLVVTGAYLSRVEVFGTPTGTEVAEVPPNHLGNLYRVTAAGPHERWVMPLPPPSDAWSETSVFVVAYDASNDQVGTATLPYTGATEIAEALWPQSDPKVYSPQNEIKEGDRGKQFTFPMNWKFLIVLDPTRYPAGAFRVNCEPLYARVQTVSELAKNTQSQSGKRGAHFRTGNPGNCTISNGDFKVNVRVVY